MNRDVVTAGGHVTRVQEKGENRFCGFPRLRTPERVAGGRGYRKKGFGKGLQACTGREISGREGALGRGAAAKRPLSLRGSPQSSSPVRVRLVIRQMVSNVVAGCGCEGCALSKSERRHYAQLSAL